MQQACCSNTPATGAFDQCAWNNYNACKQNTCPGKFALDKTEVLGFSKSGSGGITCPLKRDNSWTIIGKRELKVGEGSALCCNRGLQHGFTRKGSVRECTWFNNPDQSGPINPNTQKPGICSGECPPNLVRVALDNNGCTKGTYRALCCSHDFTKPTGFKFRDNLEYARKALILFLEQPVCPSLVSLGLKGQETINTQPV